MPSCPLLWLFGLFVFIFFLWEEHRAARTLRAAPAEGLPVCVQGRIPFSHHFSWRFAVFPASLKHPGGAGQLGDLSSAAVHAWLPTAGWVDGDGHPCHGHHCCSVTAGEGTHELSVPAALREMLIWVEKKGFLGGLFGA